MAFLEGLKALLVVRVQRNHLGVVERHKTVHELRLQALNAYFIVLSDFIFKRQIQR